MELPSDSSIYMGSSSVPLTNKKQETETSFFLLYMGYKKDIFGKFLYNSELS